MAAVSARLRFGARASSRIPTYWHGDTVAVWCEFYQTNAPSTLVAVSVVSVHVYLPGGTLLEPALTPVEESAGVWYVLIPAAYVGTYQVEMVCEVPDPARAVRSFVVQSREEISAPPAASPVTSVNGSTGAVVLSYGDVGAQPADATLTGLAALDATPGMVEQTGATSFAKRPLGVATSASILTRADGDGRYGRRVAVYAADHGVIGDGIVNDYLAMQAALTAAAGGALILTAGTIIRSESELIVPPNTDIIGHGATLTKQNGGTHRILTLASGCRLYGLKVDGRRRFGGGVTGPSIFFPGPGWFEAHGCSFYDGGSNVTIQACSDALLMGCRFELGSAGVALVGPGTAPTIESLRIIGCHFLNHRDECVDANTNVRTLVIDGCTAKGTPTLVGNEAVDIGGAHCENIIVANSIFHVAAGGNGVITKINGAPQITRRIKLSSLILIYEGVDDKIGVDLTADDIDCDDVTVVGFRLGITVTGPFSRARVSRCRVRGASHHAIQISAGSRGEDVVIEGCDLQTSSTTAAAIYVGDDVAGWTVRDNHIRGGASLVRAQASATGGELRGNRGSGALVGFDIRAPNVSMSDNRLDGGGTGTKGIALAATATGAIIGGGTRITGYATEIEDLAGDATIETLTIPDLRYNPFNARLFGAIATPLIARGEIIAATLTRAQDSGAKSTTLGSDGVTWGEVNADIARFYGTAQRLRREGARTNEVRNPRAEGAVAGTPGTMPTNWSTTLPTGISREVVGYSTRNGIPGIELRFFGTVTSGTNLVIDPETTTAIVATPSQQWTASVFAMLVSGDMTGFTNLGIGHTSRTSGGATVSGNSTSTGTLTGTMARLTKTHTTSSDPTTARVQPRIAGAVTVGATLECTMWLAEPQIEQAPFASTPILPPVGTPGASTRGADLITAALSDLGIADTGASVWIGEAMIPQAAPAGADQIIWQMDDGTDNNRIAIVNPTGGLTLVLRRTTGGVTVSSASLGTVTAGTAFKLGLAVDGAGRAVARLDAGTMRAVTGCVTSGLTTARCGDNASGTSPLFGELGTTLVSPDPLPDRVFAVLVAAGPRPLRYAQITGAP